MKFSNTQETVHAHVGHNMGHKEDKNHLDLDTPGDKESSLEDSKNNDLKISKAKDKALTDSNFKKFFSSDDGQASEVMNKVEQRREDKEEERAFRKLDSDKQRRHRLKKKNKRG